MRLRSWLLLAVALGLACARADGAWDGKGVVRQVRRAEGQVTIEHGNIEGLMPAMTMSFDVADPALLEGLEPGQYVEFRLRRAGKAFVIVALDATGAGQSGTSGVSGVGSDPLADAGDPAPDIALIDQQGHPFELRSLRGGPVLLDFIFTRCPGPCPILTGIHADVRRGLDPAERARVHLVSVTLDPAHDTPQVLSDYARKRRIETEGWFFVTGPALEVEAVARAYGVGTLRAPDGAIEHTVASFLIDADGRIVRRYLGVQHEPAAIRADIEELL